MKTRNHIGTFGLAIFLAMSSGCTKDIPLTDASVLQSVPVYKLGIGDVLRISVYNEDRLTGDFSIASDGNISFPLIGTIPAESKTVDELRDAIALRLAAGLIQQPVVTAQVITSRPFFIMGEVGRPGRYPTGERMTLLKAIATAGGFGYRANTNFVYLRREGLAGEVKIAADSDFQVLPGDVIRIGERYF